MKHYDIKERCLNFAVNIISLASQFPKTPAGYSIATQIIKSGTSVGANMAEAQDSISKKEFIKTVNISLKECRETLYWLVLIQRTKIISDTLIVPLLLEAKELRAILSAIVKKAKINS